MAIVKTAKGTELPLLNLKGKEYLQVAYRLVWFREEHPSWSIETELTTVTDKSATAKATIKDESGRIIATSHKMETIGDFKDYLEKCETGAIGRALALCGYGSQFTDDLEEGERVVDSPLNKSQGPKIFPEQPPQGDGHIPDGYRIPFGQWRNQTLEQVFRDKELKEIIGYIKYLESPAQVAGRRPELVEPVAEFIKRTSDAIATFEHSLAKELKK